MNVLAKRIIIWSKNQMKKLFCIILLIIPSLCFSQRYLWQRSLGTNGKDKALQMLKTKDNGYLILSYKISPDYNFYLIKLDSAFNQKWQKHFTYANSIGPYSIFETLDNNFILAGQAGDTPVSTGNVFGWLLKMDSNGDTLWTKKYPKWVDTYFNKVIQLSDSNYLLRFYYSTSRLGLMKVNGIGDSIWNIKLTPIDFISLQDSFIAINSTYFRKYTNNGQLVLDKSLSLLFGVSRVFPIKEGGYLLAGSNQGMGLAKLTANGDTIWSRRYIENVSIYAQDVQQTADSGFLVLGYGENIEGNDIVLLKADKNGNRQWRIVLRIDYNDETPANLFLNCDSSIVIVGTATNGFIGSDDIMLLKIDSLPYVFGPCGLPDAKPGTMLKEREIVTYPNPVKEELKIRTKDPFTGNVTISNLLGQVIANYNFTDINYFNLPFSAYSPGLYILTLTDPENKEVNKIKVFKH